MNLFDYENIKHVGSIKSYELQLSFLRFNTALQIAKCEPLSRAVSHESSIIIIIFFHYYYYYYYIELTHSKTILEISVEIEPQPAALDFKNLSQYSSRAK